MNVFESISGKRILLIGGAGFIGHHIALRLKSLGAEVGIVDSLQVNNLLSFISPAEKKEYNVAYLDITNERLGLLKKAGIKVDILDARDYHDLSRVVGDFQPQVVIQLAAVAHAGKSNKDPYSTFDHSLRTLENALDASRELVEHFIFFSSSMVYGDFEDGYVTEDSICNPLGIYGALKYAGEKMVIAYNQVFDLPYTIIRPSALYGERCVSRRVGQIFIENAIQGLEISINGDGEDRLDFTYIQDLVQGVLCCIEKKESRNEIFNITYGESRSIADMANILKGHFPEIELNFHPRDKLMPARGTLSVNKAKQLLGYQPEYPLEKGYVDYINWYKESFVTEPSFQMIDLNDEPLRSLN